MKNNEDLAAELERASREIERLRLVNQRLRAIIAELRTRAIIADLAQEEREEP
jgi:hypothetical protein